MKKLVLITTIVLVVLAVATTSTEAVDVERDALMALYNSTNGPGWTDSIGWGTADPHCNWYGVTCTSGNVTSLDLHTNQLSGPIPAELGNLSNLQDLRLYANQLSGPIPAELGNLSNLQDLWLYVNQLSGPIPAELGNLSNLQDLDLHINQLSGPIPAELGNLANLQYLHLRNNQLSGSIPAELGNLSNLVFLYLDNNPALVCWQTQAALSWAQNLRSYAGPEVVCQFVYLPIILSAGAGTRSNHHPHSY